MAAATIITVAGNGTHTICYMLSGRKNTVPLPGYSVHRSMPMQSMPSSSLSHLSPRLCPPQRSQSHTERPALDDLLRMTKSETDPLASLCLPSPIGESILDRRIAHQISIRNTALDILDIVRCARIDTVQMARVEAGREHQQ